MKKNYKLLQDQTSGDVVLKAGEVVRGEVDDSAELSFGRVQSSGNTWYGDIPAKDLEEIPPPPPPTEEEQKEASILIASKMQEAEAIIKECEAIARKARVEFGVSGVGEGSFVFVDEDGEMVNPEYLDMDDPEDRARLEEADMQWWAPSRC